MARATKKDKELTTEEKLVAALVPKVEQPYPVPENWCWVKFGALSEDMADGPFGSNLKTEHYTNNQEARIIQLSNIGEEGWREENTKYTTFSHAEEIKRSIVSPGDIVIAKMMPAGRAIICPDNEKMYILSSDAVKMVPRKSLNVRYIVNAINSPFFRNQVQENTQGITRARTSIKKLKEYCFPLPPLAEQQRIVDIIESLFADLDAAKEKLTAVLDGFAERKAAILHQAFTGELIGIANGNTVPLSEITESIRIGPFGSALHKEDYVLGGIPVVNPKHIANQCILPEQKVAITQKKADELCAYKLKVGDIVMGRRGEMGRSAPVTEREDGWLCGTGSLIIRLKDGYDAAFYSQVIASNSSVQYLEENCVGSTMKNLNEKIINSLPVPNYSKEQQKEIMAILSDIFDKERQAQAAVEEVLTDIDTLKKSILARALRGELGTGNPADESATELLRRVL